MQLKYIFLLCALMFSFYYVNGLYVEKSSSLLEYQYCGHRLTQMISLVCRSHGYTPRMYKRSLGGKSSLN
ncbi:unnamed protein product [Diabrotica balteata]|uniref:Uncharacterized protein n=1 Tax=Diabrotica balteata TaxID=107213 RepID=A0A9P0GZ26_DIABA|nr:unnamed protein product [Diabrotica balteata]